MSVLNSIQEKLTENAERGDLGTTEIMALAKTVRELVARIERLERREGSKGELPPGF